MKLKNFFPSWILIFISSIAVAAAPGSLPVPNLEPRFHPRIITAEMAEQIVDYFTQGACDKALGVLANAAEYRALKATPLAVIAYCGPKTGGSEELFLRAEELEPSNDTVYVLHARYRWKTDPASSEELWRKVLLLARNAATQEMAREYLAGFGDAEEEISVTQRLHWNTRLQVGVSSESNPQGLAFGSNLNGSTATNLQFGAGVIKATDFGSVTTNYSLTNNRYFTQHDVDLLEHDLEVPVALHVGATEDLVFRPFGSYLTLGDSGLEVLGGMGIMGVSFKSTYRQSVQGLIFQDHYYLPDLAQQDGIHFRFEYDWQFFPQNSSVRALFYFEHVKADSDTDTAAFLNIPYSHNDIGFHGFLNYDLKSVIFGFYPKLMLREDDSPATYLSSSVGLTSKRREDIQLVFQPNITVRLTQFFQLFGWYEWNRTFSNVGPGDYADHNLMNQTFGLAIRSFAANRY